MEDKIPFKRKTQQMGNSLAIGIPEEIANYLQFEKGQELIIIVDTNKKGQKYMAVYKGKQNGK